MIRIKEEEDLISRLFGEKEKKEILRKHLPNSGNEDREEFKKRREKILKRKFL